MASLRNRGDRGEREGDRIVYCTTHGGECTGTIVRPIGDAMWVVNDGGHEYAVHVSEIIER